MKTFDIPSFYRSPLISRIKEHRKLQDPRKKDFTPTLVDLGPVRFLIARHFGFCYGVENAIEISYRALAENPGKRIFLLSQMIHNPDVNSDLLNHGIQFLMDTQGNQLIPWETLAPEDIVIIPAFGTTLAIEAQLESLGIAPHRYNTTCPFVERVWKKSEKLGSDRYTIIIHGKHNHEETRATFSRSEQNAPSIIIKDIREARILGSFILGQISSDEFNKAFSHRISTDFDIFRDLDRVGVINQTTMLASETQEIADYFREVMAQKFGTDNLNGHFADTRDTLCYATNENQDATYGLLKEEADLAVVVGGYNSSNTSHLVELCERKFKTFFISSSREIISENEIHHFDFHHHKPLTTNNYLPQKEVITIAITSGASCPDAVVDEVIGRLVSFFPEARPIEQVIESLSVAV